METDKSVAHRVTLRPSRRQCAGSPFSALQSMKSSVPPPPNTIQTSQPPDLTFGGEGGRGGGRTSILFAEWSEEEGGALERGRGDPELGDLRDPVRHRCWLLVVPESARRPDA